MTYTVRADDAYVQGMDGLSVDRGHGGGNFRSGHRRGRWRRRSRMMRTATVTLSPTSAATVVEGRSVVYTASVNNAVTGRTWR